MAVKSFISPSIKWVPQPGFSVIYTENGGIEAIQDILVRNSDVSNPTANLSLFTRGTPWEQLWPEVPAIYKALTMKTFDPQDRGDGWSFIRCTFTGYQFTGNGSSGEEVSVPTSSLIGQLEDVPLSQHPKWKDLEDVEKLALGKLITGEWGYGPDPFEAGGANYTYRANSESAAAVTPDPITSANAIKFAKIIAEGESTYRRGGWTYSYHTEASNGFSGGQLSSLGKIVNNPPGNPVDPGTGWTWLLAGPNQTQSGVGRFMKTLDFQLIQDNETNNFLYG